MDNRLPVEVPTFPYGYKLYGLRVVSNRPRPDLAALAAGDWPAVELALAFLGDQPIPSAYGELPWRLLEERVDPFTTLRIWVASTRAGWAHRLCSSSGSGYLELFAIPHTHSLSPSVQPPGRIEIYWQDSQAAPDEVWHNVATWVFDVGLSYVARLSIPANLHGSALVMDGKAIALVGGKGAGKSTLAAALLAAGCAFLTDDHIALWPRGDRFCIEPGAPRLRLWPTSLPVLNVSADALRRVYTFNDKRILDVGPTGAHLATFQASALPLDTIYVLEARDAAATEPCVVALPSVPALHALWLHRYARVSISPEQSAQELAMLAQVVQNVRVCQLYRPDGLDSLPRVVEALRGDLAQ